MMIKCDKCKDNKLYPSLQLISELTKANNEFCKLYEKYDIILNFLQKIVLDWKCDINHAKAVLDEIRSL